MWWLEDDILTWSDTGEQWEVRWTHKDFDDFCGMDSDKQLRILEKLKEVEA